MGESITLIKQLSKAIVNQMVHLFTDVVPISEGPLLEILFHYIVLVT